VSQPPAATNVSAFAFKAPATAPENGFFCSFIDEMSKIASVFSDPQRNANQSSVPGHFSDQRRRW
jgi:hypothetical protein